MKIKNCQDNMVRVIRENIARQFIIPISALFPFCVNLIEQPGGGGGQPAGLTGSVGLSSPEHLPCYMQEASSLSANRAPVGHFHHYQPYLSGTTVLK